MGRPVKRGLDYFPLDVDFFTNKKIKALRRAHGLIGVLTYLNLLCRIYENGYYYRFDSLSELSLDIAEEIANEQIKRVATCVTETINYLVGQEILAEGLFKQGIISGPAMQEQYGEILRAMKRKADFEEYSLIPLGDCTLENKVFTEETGVFTEESTLNKRESKSKKEIKKRVRPRKKAHGEFKNVLLTDIELEKLRAEHSDTDEAIEFLSRYIERKGYKSKSHYLCILDWVFKALEERRAMNTPRSKDTYSPGGSFDTDDFFNAAVERSMSFDP